MPSTVLGVILGALVCILLAWFNPGSILVGHVLPLPVNWNGCQMHYRIATDGLPEGGIQVIKSAADEVQKATGITMIYDGTTDSPLTSEPGAPNTVTIGWTSNPDLLGEHAMASTWVYAQRGQITSATIAVDADEPTSKELTRYTLIHEFGHVLGIEHTTNAGSVMNDTVGYGDGSLHGTDRQMFAQAGTVACQS